MDNETNGIIDDIVEYLCDHISVSLVGFIGSGRSRAARIAGDQLRMRGFSIIAAYGVAALRDQPLAALRVAGLNIPASAPSIISAAVDALSALMNSPRSVLIIDDADDLDSVSVGVVAAAHARQGFPVLSITRPRGRGQSAGRTPVIDLQPGVRLTLDPPSFDQLHRIVHKILPGPVSPSTVAQVATLSGGLPNLVKAIVDTGRRTGAIVQDRGVWQARGDLWSNRLVQVASPFVANLADNELDALDRLAFAGTTTVGEAREVVSDRLFVQLAELGLLQGVETPEGSVVGVFPPLLADYLCRTGMTISRLDSIAKEAAFPEIGAISSAPRLSLPHSRVAILNKRIAEHGQVEVDALRAIWQSDPNAENAVALLAALNEASAEPAEFAAVFDSTNMDGAETQWSARFAEWQAAYQGFVLGDLDGARQILSHQRGLLPRFATLLRSTEAMLCLLAASSVDDELLAPAGPDEDSLGAEALEMTRLLVLVTAGRTREAWAALPSQAPVNPRLVEVYHVAAGLAQILHGEFDDGVEWALRAMTEAETRLSPGEIHAHAYVAALGLMYSGRLDELRALLDRVLTLKGATMLREYCQVGVLTLAALSAGWRGQTGYAASLVAQAGAIGLKSGSFPGMLSGFIPSPDDPAAGEENTGEKLWQAARERVSSGYVAAGIGLASAAVEICVDADQAAAIVKEAQSSQSPFLMLLGKYIAATIASDPDALAACISGLYAQGARLHAVRAAVTRSLVLRQRGDIEASVRQAEDAWTQASKLGQKCQGLFYRLGRAVGLSPREREIALLLADGMTNQAIASSLSLSLRTVENYLSSAYRKLGSEGRAELALAVSTWAAQQD